MYIYYVEWNTLEKRLSESKHICNYYVHSYKLIMYVNLCFRTRVTVMKATST